MKQAAPALTHCAGAAPDVQWDPSVNRGAWREIQQGEKVFSRIALNTTDTVTIIHELGHHLDYVCGARSTLVEAVVRAQGLPAGTPWSKQGPPTRWPAEYFANAVVIIMGYQTRHNVSPATVAVVREWMTGVPQAQTPRQPAPTTTTTTTPAKRPTTIEAPPACVVISDTLSWSKPPTCPEGGVVIRVR